MSLPIDEALDEQLVQEFAGLNNSVLCGVPRLVLFSLFNLSKDGLDSGQFEQFVAPPS